MRPMLLLGYAHVRANLWGESETDHHCRIREPPCAGLSGFESVSRESAVSPDESNWWIWSIGSFGKYEDL